MTMKLQSSEKKTSKKDRKVKVKGWIGNHFVESILYDSKEAFLCYNKETKGLEVHQTLEDQEWSYVPCEKDSYGYDTYSFSSLEFNNLLFTNITKESLLDEIKQVVDDYLVARDEIKYLVIGDILLTYCYEWISTTHFIFAVGDINSGKSTLTRHFHRLGYRCLYGTNLPYADIYNFLGKDEEGAGTIAEDEAQDISFERNKIRLYKNSYNKGNRQPIIDMQNGRKQIFYWTFCFKAFSGERLPFDKGMLDRLAVCFMMQGKPKKNIKDPGVEDQEIFRKLRNKMLLWKLLNIEKGLEGTQFQEISRDQEFYENYLKIMSGTKYEAQGKNAVEYFVKQRHERIWDSTEAKIFRLVLKVMKENNEVYFQDLWNSLADGSEIEVNFDKGSYVDRDTGQRISQNFVAKILVEKFQGKKMVRKEFYENNKQKRITYYVFDEKILAEFTKKYNVESDSVLDQK
ncbi:MAG: hypothetical protein KGH99_06915 [Thaumarchaeota archaeon]|nr:hypothetical protein [Nitrososphaerota archaeon]